MTVSPRTGSDLDIAVAELEDIAFRADISVHAIAPPAGLAPFTFAVAADVRPGEDGESVYGTGRLVLLHDPGEPEAWGGPWRIIIFAQAPLELDIGVDPLVSDVAWAWLVDALESLSARYHSASGTTTKSLSKGFGSLESEGDGAQIELRASWTPEAPFGPHFEAWVEFVSMLAGLPPGSEQIELLGARRIARG